MPKVLNKYKASAVEIAGAISVMRPSIWGNPYSHQPYTRAAHRVRSRAEAVIAHRLWFLTSDDAQAVELRRLARLPVEQGGLRGADVFCCCAPLPCHGDVLIEYANAPNEDGCRVCLPEEPCRHLEALRKANSVE